MIVQVFLGVLFAFVFIVFLLKTYKNYFDDLLISEAKIADRIMRLVSEHQTNVSMENRITNEHILTMLKEIYLTIDKPQLSNLNNGIKEGVDNINDNLKILHDQLLYTLQEGRTQSQADLEIVHNTTRDYIGHELKDLKTALTSKKSPRSRKSEQ